MPHSTQYRVYYEDTDAAGIVYYANYLKFAERARTEWLRTLGFNQSAMWKDQGLGFVVRRVESDFLAPARLDDIIIIETHLQEASKVRITMQQTMKREAKVLATLCVTLAMINREGKPLRLPRELSEILLHS